jgi:hypothetical protein
MERDDEYAERKMKKGVQKAADLTFAMQIHEEAHPPARLDDVRYTDDEEGDDGKPGNGYFHKLILREINVTSVFIRGGTSRGLPTLLRCGARGAIRRSMADQADGPFRKPDLLSLKSLFLPQRSTKSSNRSC